MMKLREITAVAFFLVGMFLLITLWVKSFQLIYAVSLIICFLLAYFIWPGRKRGNYRDDNIYLDLLEFIIELPFEILLRLFRVLMRLFHKSDVPDIDL